MALPVPTSILQKLHITAGSVLTIDHRIFAWGKNSQDLIKKLFLNGAQHGTALENLEKKMETRFDQQDKRFDQQDKRFDQQDKRFDQQDKRFDKIEDTLAIIINHREK